VLEPLEAARPPTPVNVTLLFREQGAWVWRLLRRLGVPLSALDDAVQEVFIVVHRRRAELSIKGAGRALLSAIAVRVARDQRRSGHRRQVGEVVDLPAAQRDPHQHAEARQAVELALNLLEGLDAEKREVFVMAELEGMTAPEMAEVLELKINTVYSRLRAARLEFDAAVQARQQVRP
jgi:RNA polymerase sigma-70 factor (ECF subfamily)